MAFGWSKTTRISVMLGIDTVFFLVELISGFLVGSLALTADAFHMLNDIISLLVGLWAVIVAKKATTAKYSYGWLRAEILGAFFNAVFLIALCVSIVMEALSRFFDPPEIKNPDLILIVGSLGLASNLVGFLVLGGHGHSHGPGEHSHDGHDHGHEHAHSHGADDLGAAERGQADGGRDPRHAVADENGRVADILPDAAVARYANNASPETIRRIKFDRNESPEHSGHGTSTSRGRDRRRGSFRHRPLEDLSIHPSTRTQEIIAAGQHHHDDETGSEGEASSDENTVNNEETPLISKNVTPNSTYGAHSGYAHRHRSRRDSGVHTNHNHVKPKKTGKKSGGGHSHSHDDMGMNAMILHVLGDALGNVGVIVTALIIKLTDWPGRFYADPAVSLFITLIILRSAIPLTVAASRILLQATPDSIDAELVREDIQDLPGVVSCHHVHIWQLSDTKIVASMHIQVNFPITEGGGERFMELSRRARNCLHAYGIHSATIQPEFCLDVGHNHGEVEAAAAMDGTADGPRGCGDADVEGCLVSCVESCVGQGCCPPGLEGSKPPSSGSHRGDEHDHDHDHDSHNHGHSH